jgi:mannose-1-phosphate guanylyltransferase
VALADEAPSGLALVGATAGGPATDLGWIVPRGRARVTPTGGLTVERFVEKPSEAVARALMAKGGLWNTMVAAARGKALWRLLRSRLPEQTGAIERYGRRIGQPDARAVLADAYRLMPAADLSRAVLQSAPGLAVVPMADAGWSDCGTPERLFECLQGTESGPATASPLPVVPAESFAPAAPGSAE